MLHIRHMVLNCAALHNITFSRTRADSVHTDSSASELLRQCLRHSDHSSCRREVQVETMLISAH
jgi:hypothetical protein